ncbi:MAG: TRAP transporter large permease, partial [Clostridiaceae bacterium]|nr:TRAP transporter large permease [Clostridiaceae bacterium]
MIESIVIISFILFVVLLLFDVPVPFAILAGSISYAMATGENLMLFAQKMALSFADSTMQAIPAFLFVGIIMTEIGLTDKLFNFCVSWIGHIKGGLAHVNVLGSMIFAGMSGSVLADAGGLGVIEVETMKRAGYDENFSVALTATSACIGPIIPPSINFLIWAYLSSCSGVTMFAAGMIPGILLGISLMVMSVIIFKVCHIAAPKTRKYTMKERFFATVSALPAIGGPAILLVGTLSGVFTTTECGAVAAVYCILVAIYYRKLNIPMLKRVMKSTLSSSAMVMVLCAAGNVFNWMIINSGLMGIISGMLLALNNKFLILLILNIIMLIMGCFIGSMQILIMMAPLLISLSSALDISLIQMGCMAVFCLVIGSVTPPFAPALF